MLQLKYIFWRKSFTLVKLVKIIYSILLHAIANYYAMHYIGHYGINGVKSGAQEVNDAKRKVAPNMAAVLLNDKVT